MKERRLNSKVAPRLAITMGYAAGIGPEILVKSLVNPVIRRYCRPLVIGDSRVLQNISQKCGTSIKWNRVLSSNQVEYKPGQIDLLDIQNTPMDKFEWGKVIPSLGKASGKYIEVAWELVMNGEVEGIISGTLHKEALHKGGYRFRDELELFENITKRSNSFFIGVNEKLWTISIADHVSFKEIANKITKENVLFHIKAIDRSMQQYGFERPKIAVAALNVHGGEDGLFGDEEMKTIRPAILEARKLGIESYGPYPADTIFLRAQKGEFNAIVGMYHDQINIGRKLIGWKKGTSIMMGLPVPCGTTSHGTAFDIAGKCMAHSSSMEFTIKTVSKLTQCTR